jgi:hypothetical protein
VVFVVIRAVVAGLALLAECLVICVLIVAAHFTAVNPLVVSKGSKRACVGLDAFSTIFLAFRRIIARLAGCIA